MMFSWNRKVIKNKEDAYAMMAFFKAHQPAHSALDTETTGLHIIFDTPFVVQFGWVDLPNKQGYAWAIDLEELPVLGREIIKAYRWMSEQCEKLIGHNLKFDLHMLKNIGFDFNKDNFTDTMFYIRYGTDAVQEGKGGAPLSLKAFATRYIDKSARLHERSLDQERTAIAAKYNKRLKDTMGMRKKDIDEFFKDVTNDLEDWTPEYQERYNRWRIGLPDWLRDRFDVTLRSSDIPYNVLDRPSLLKYALDDIVWTLETFYLLKPIAELRENIKAIEIEDRLILPLMDMERVGFNIDKDYFNNARIKMKSYIRERRSRFWGLAGQRVKASQHATIKNILLERFGVQVTSTNADELSRLKAQLISDSLLGAAEFIEILQELRTLEKWYSTYLIRFKLDLQRSSRLYTDINQVGTISGRVTSDFQQFPREAIVDIYGREIFNPRKMVQATTTGGYHALVYIDYSQIELRIQAMYTILVEDPEPNLCRAYMPYGCHDETGVPFDPSNPEMLKRWRGTWYLDESPETVWQPQDVHAATTIHAFNITPDHPEFKHYRSIGKTINFAKNYGAQFFRIKQMFPEYSDEQIDRIDKAYYKAFPGVRTYHNYCYALAASQAYAMNLFGPKYYNVSGHNLINILIQGSGASLLKIKIRELWEYAKAHNIKSRMQMNIHDELSWEKHQDDDLTIFLEFKRIMENWPETLVPIVAEIEKSESTWADKEEWQDEGTAD